ncbi:MAG: D-alanyl-D-alanine carboxypeptidase [Holosporales bacterium]|jgi:D-alanyl-D-alanine carboxypeptidase (penicillin-binding protein 5/6)|nr:D-alanyl-D-alanine carboxypeptidase [Holosporales bacterium]
MISVFLTRFSKIFCFFIIFLGEFCFFERQGIFAAEVDNKKIKNQNKIKQNKKSDESNIKKIEEETESQYKEIISSNYAFANLPSTLAKQAILQDFNSGAILFEKNADELMTPSSITKIATASFIFNKIQEKQLSLDTIFVVSANAFRKEGSSMFLKQGQKVSLKDLLLGLIVLSGNDAAVTIAEGACGDEKVFASELTSFVISIGATNTHFINASGLPDEKHKTTARDILAITRYTINTFPKEYKSYSVKEFTFNGVKQFNRNTLLNQEIGCDGVKTGKTESGGCGIVASINQNGRRLILVVNGYLSEKDREKDAKALLLWGMKMFRNQSLYKANEVIAQIPVWYGNESYLPITVENDLIITLPRLAGNNVKIELHYDTPISAPVNKGDRIGEIQITSDSFKTPIVIPLVASISIRSAGFFKKVYDSFLYLIWGIRMPDLKERK